MMRLILYIQTVKSPTPLPRLFGKSNAHIIAHEDPSTDSLPILSDEEKPLPLRAILIPRVICAAANYAALSLVDIAYRAIQPLFLSTPIELGGLGLSPPEIGQVMSLYGILNGFVQLFVFARVHDRWGSKRVFMFGMMAAIPLFAFFPFLNYLARSSGVNSTVWAMVVLQTIVSAVMTLSFGNSTVIRESFSTDKNTLIRRGNIHLYYRSIPEPRIYRNYERTRANDGVGHAGDRACGCQLVVLAVDRKTISW